MNENSGERTVDLPPGEIRYRDEGAGEPIVFVHGLLVDDFMAALDLDGVTLVGNDTGGAISQLVAADHPGRLARLVLTPCDAYRDFFPPAFRPLQVAARIPGAITALLQPMWARALRPTPLAYGLLTKRRLPDDLLAHWIEPALRDPAVRRDVVKVLRGISNRYTLDAAQRLRDLEKPVLIAWAPEDKFFKLANARRLAAEIPGARLELIEDSLTFVPLDQPQAVADLVAEFVGAGDGPAADSPAA